MRIAIVNDLRMAVEILRRVVASIEGVSIAWIAEDGVQAVARYRDDRPDVILMDMIMPNMDGVEATRQIMSIAPCPILVTTATVTGNSDKVYEALGYGAMDAVDTPTMNPDGSLAGADQLLRKLACITRIAHPHLTADSLGRASVPRAASAPHAVTPLVAIGASTGGPSALQRVLSDLPRPLPFAVLVLQHLEYSYVPGLATWLARETRRQVELTHADQVIQPNKVYLAHTHDHLLVDAGGRLRMNAAPDDRVHRPSIDVLFRSLVRYPGTPGVAAILTGMGDDGAAGMAQLAEAGWCTIAQDEATSIVWGMPGAAVRRGATNRVLPLDQIGAEIGKQMHRIALAGM